MRLRTLAGAYAGTIRDYSFGAAQAALSNKTAERVSPLPVRPSVPSVSATAAATAAIPPRAASPMPPTAERRGARFRR